MSNPRIVKEGGYQPTADPGPVPTSLIQRTVDGQIVKALAHLDRVRILMTLIELDEAGPRELARKLDVSLGEVGYHIKVLKDLGVIEPVRTETHRGWVEHYYRARVATISPSMFKMISSKRRLGLRPPAVG
jgi:DNA-binding transcriptional ArsR family regulator